MHKIRISLKKIIGGETFYIYSYQKFIKYAVNLVLFLLFAVCFASNTLVMAQGCDNVTACVTGEVRDRDKNPVPNAVVRFKHKSKGITIITRTDLKGVYIRNGLEPGDYTITVSAPNFLESESRDQTLYATQKPTIIPAFELISVTSAATGSVQPSPIPSMTPTVNPAPYDSLKEVIALEPQHSVNFGSSEVMALPLGGSTFVRSFDELAFLVPGVAPPPQAIGNSVGPGVGPGVGTSGQFSVNGLRSRANNFMVDGSDNNDEDIGVRRQGFFTLVPQSIESVQEFTIITALAPAIFGRNLGAQVNVISKTGGNDFHGTLYAFFNSSNLNARNYFDYVGESRCDVSFVNGRCPLQARRLDGSSINVFTTDSNNNQNQIFSENDAGDEDSLTFLQGGGTLGGPIVRDKMFFFVSAEGQLLNAVKESHFAVPTVEQRGFLGRGAQGFSFYNPSTDAASNAPPATFIGSYVLGLFPFPNDPASEIYGRNTYTRVLPANARGRVISGKYDYSFGGEDRKQTFTSRYNYTDDWRDLQQVGGAVFSSIRPLTRTDNFSAYLSGALTDKLSNVLRLSWGRTRLRFEENNYAETYLRRVNRDLNSDESRFLLNSLGLVNRTRAVTVRDGDTDEFIGFALASQVTFGIEGQSIEQLLGPIGQVNIYGFSPLGVDVFNFPQQRVNNTYQFADTMFLTSGNHNIAFGVDVRRSNLESDLPRNSRLLLTSAGGFRASNYPATNPFQIPSLISPIDLVAAGAATGVFQSIVLPDNDANINLSYNQLNFFVQDDYRIKTNLSISYGLRYELNTVPEEADRKIEDALQSTLPQALSGLNQFINGREKIYDLDSNNLAPRIGLAYAPNPSTVIRGGYGIYYDQILGAVVSQSRNVFPTFSTVNFGGVSPGVGNINNFRINTPYNFIDNNGQPIQIIRQGTLNTLNSAVLTQQQLINIFAQNVNRFPTPFGATIPDRDLDTPLAHQYSIGVEQEFSDTIFSIAYVGTTGRNLLRFTTPNAGRNNIVNISDLSLTGGILALSGNNRAPIREQSNIGSIDRFETTGRSQYHSLQFQLRGRLVRSFQYQIGYTLANAKDDVSDVFDLAGAPALPQNSAPGKQESEYAAANFDVRHRFTYNFVYDLPALNSQNNLVEYLLGGWQLAGTGRYNTGQPFTVNTIYDVNQDGNPTDRLNSVNGIEITGDRRQPLRLTANPLTLLAPIGQDGAVPRNSFRAGDLLELDLSFSKRFFVREAQNLQLRFDIFNFINRANFGVPVRFLEFPSFGQAVETITSGRRIQIALKYNF